MAVRVLIAREAVVTRGDKTAMEGRRISPHPTAPLKPRSRHTEPGVRPCPTLQCPSPFAAAKYTQHAVQTDGVCHVEFTLATDLLRSALYRAPTLPPAAQKDQSPSRLTRMALS
jgi:hypothetical protein